MSTLHIVSKSPFAHNALADCLRVCGDAVIVLIEDGVNAALADTAWTQALKRDGLSIRALQADVEARGLNGHIDPAFSVIDAAGFVQLCCEHSRILSWY